MANSQSLQTFNFQSKQLRTLTIDNEPWFVAVDVCEFLELSNSRQAVARLDSDEKGVISNDTPGGKQESTIVNEPGLYSLIMGSRKPEAKQFKRWVTHEVLPAIRQTGSYQASPSPALGTMRFSSFEYHGTHWLMWLEGTIRLAPRPVLELLGVEWPRWSAQLERQYGTWGVVVVSERLPGTAESTLVMMLGRTTRLLQEIGAEVPPDRRALYDRYLTGLEAALLREWQNRYTPTRESLLAGEPLSVEQQTQIKTAIQSRIAGSEYERTARLYLYGRLKRHFQVETWSDICRADFDAALALVEAEDGRELLPPPTKHTLLPAVIATETAVKRPG